jgi:hypothetical protein
VASKLVGQPRIPQFVGGDGLRDIFLGGWFKKRRFDPFRLADLF